MYSFKKWFGPYTLNVADGGTYVESKEISVTQANQPDLIESSIQKEQTAAA